MLKWLGGGEKIDHPMADAKDAKEIIAAFPSDDSGKALDEAIHWIDSITHTKEFGLVQRYQLIDQLDLAVKRHQQKLLELYLALKPGAKFQEAQLWRASTEFWRVLAEAYLACVTQIDLKQAAGSSFRKTLPVLVARAMRAVMLQIKWILMRYGYVDVSYWNNVAKLYAFSESGGCTNEVIDIYPGLHGVSSVKQEFLRVLMLGVSSTGGLSPSKQNITERVIAHFMSRFVLERRATDGCSFWFDLSGSQPPTRVLVKPPAGAAACFFGAGAALDEMQKLMDFIDQNGVLPSDVSLGTENAELLSDTLLHLAFNWDRDLPARDSERRSVAATIHVTHGFDGVWATLQGTPDGEKWVVENASAEGYGAVVPEGKGDWLQVGVLLGIQTGDGAGWGAGIVRRVETDERKRRRVGIQMVSRHIVPGSMCSTGHGARGAAQNVILLDAEPSRSGYIQSLLRHDTFTLRDALEATRVGDGKTFMLIPSGVIESGADFERVRFQVDSGALAA